MLMLYKFNGRVPTHMQQQQIVEFPPQWVPARKQVSFHDSNYEKTDIRILTCIKIV